MKIAINAISAKLGGAATYLQNVLPELKTQLAKCSDSQLIVWRSEASTADQTWPGAIDYRRGSQVSGKDIDRANPLRRLWFDQVALPKKLQAESVDVLFSSANYGLLRRTFRQVLLVRNTVPFDDVYLERMPAKVKAICLLQRWLILRSITASSVVIFPSEAMLDLAAKFTNGRRDNWRVAHFGARPDLFYPQNDKTKPAGEIIKLLHVSFYCDQKNLGTLMGAVQNLSQQHKKRYLLQLTAGFDQEWLGNLPSTPNFRRDQALYRQLAADGSAHDASRKSYETLPDLYRSADIFVFPSYTESFGHPLVEAMASGLPIIASDIPVNRELCGEAAVYCPPFDIAAWAETIQRVAEDRELRLRLSAAALQRSKAFTWEKHVTELMKTFTGSTGEL